MVKQKTTTVRELDKRKDLSLVDRDMDVQSIKDYFPKKVGINDYEAFFVKIRNGDYDEVWGIENNIPYLDEIAYRVK